MARRILVLNQYFPPDIASTGNIAEALCEALAASGAEVTAIVGQPSYAVSLADAPAKERRSGLTIQRVAMGRRRGRGSLGVRLLGYARFLVGAWLESRRQETPDVVVTFHNPPLVGLLGAVLARKYRVPFVYIVQDIHPDIVERTGTPRLPRWVLAAWRRLSRMTLHRATLTIVLSDAMKDYLVKRYGVAARAIVAIPLWAHPDLEHLATDARSRGSLTVLYAGNMGVMHPVEILVSAAEKVRSPAISFVFVGDGAKRRNLERLARELSLDNVRFLPFQPQADFEALVERADLCAVALEVGLEDLCLPSRTPTFMSAGKPILAVMSERAPQTIELVDAHAGWWAGSVDTVARVLEELSASPDRLRPAGDAARSLYRQRYRREALLSRYVSAVLGAGQTPIRPEPS